MHRFRAARPHVMRAMASDSSVAPKLTSPINPARMAASSDRFMEIIERKGTGFGSSSSSYRQRSGLFSGRGNRNTSMLDLDFTPEKVPANGKLRVGYVLHGKFTRNNVVLTLSSQYIKVGRLAEGMSPQDIAIDRIRPSEDALINLSTGCLGFRNTKQGQYEAAFQTAARMFEKMEEKGYLDKNLELVFRDFSEGREAFLNALTGKEGSKVRRMVTRVTDATKIKFGGQRSPGRRRV